MYSYQPKENREKGKVLAGWRCWLFPLSEGYLSYILIALFNVFCSTNNQLMNIVYLCFLHRREYNEQRVYWECGAFKW